MRFDFFLDSSVSLGGTSGVPETVRQARMSPISGVEGNVRRSKLLVSLNLGAKRSVPLIRENSQTLENFGILKDPIHAPESNESQGTTVFEQV